MSDSIRLVIVDDVKEARDNIRALLELGSRIEVVGEAENGNDALLKAKELFPDIMLMDINMPVKDGVEATKEISIEFPEIAIIITSVQDEPEYMRRAMSAGAREYIVKPFSCDDLVETVVRTYDLELKRRRKMIEPKPEEKINARIISVFSSKGGTGKTTIATNLAISLAKQTKKGVALLDLDMLFGNVAVLMNVSVKTNIAELVKVINSLDEELLDEYMVTHISSVRVLTAPVKPEYAEYITDQHIKKILNLLSRKYHYIVIDTASNFSETTLAALDASDRILFISTTELPCIQNTITGLGVMETLKYPDSKVDIVLNRASEQFGVKYTDFEGTIKHKIWAYIPEDNLTVIKSANKGLPFVMTRTKSQVTVSLNEIGSRLIAGEKQITEHKPFFKRVLGIRK